MGDGSGRFALEASLGQTIAGPVPEVMGIRVDSGFWFADRLAEALGSMGTGMPTVAEAAMGLAALPPASLSSAASRDGAARSSPMASDVRLPEARLVVMPLPDPSRVRIQISGVPGARWRLQSMDGFRTDPWRDAGEVELDSHGSGFIETDAGGESAARFYRLARP